MTDNLPFTIRSFPINKREFIETSPFITNLEFIDTSPFKIVFPEEYKLAFIETSYFANNLAELVAPTVKSLLT